MTKWMANNYFFVIKSVYSFWLARSHSQSKIYKLNDQKRAAKNTIKLLFKNCDHGYIIKIMAKTIKCHWISQGQ